MKPGINIIRNGIAINMADWPPTPQFTPTDHIIMQPKLNVTEITEMSALGERVAGRDAASAFINEHEERGVTIAAQEEQIVGLQKTIGDMANRIDLLTKQYNDSKDDAGRYMRYAVELSTQLRTNVAANVRALAIADEVMMDSALANRVEDIEKALSTKGVLATFQDVPNAIMDSDKEPIPDNVAAPAPQPMLIPVGVYLDETAMGSYFRDAKGVSMSGEFMKQWMHRADEFPQYVASGARSLTDNPLDMPSETDDTTEATRMLMNISPTLKN